MDVRIRGTPEECARFVEMVRRTVPAEYIKTISKYYPDTRKCSYSTEGRVYLSFRETFTGLALKEGAKE